jgi:hypothetical protein
MKEFGSIASICGMSMILDLRRSWKATIVLWWVARYCSM